MRIVSAVPVVWFLWLCSGAALAEDAAPAGFNPFEEAYVSQRASTPGPHAAPRLHAGQDRLLDHQRLLEDGYDLLGYSAFEAGDVPVERLREFSARLDADLVLVYSERLERMPAAIRQQRARAAEERQHQGLPPQERPADEAFYDYFASYWVKLPPPLFGSHVQRHMQGEDAAGGLEVIAVIHGSPAERAGVQRGDVLKRMGEVTLDESAQLVEAVQRYAGQQVGLTLERDGAPLQATVQLNPAQ